jgi:cytochrome c peroxidase
MAIVVGSRVVSAQNEEEEKLPPAYNPYPPGILPKDLPEEIERVRREVRAVEKAALATSQTLPKPLVVTGNPPTIQGSGYQALEDLGELLNFDEKMSPFKDEACAFCHMPYAGFSGPIPSVNLTMIAYPGTFHFRAGKRVPRLVRGLCSPASAMPISACL